MLGSGGMYLLLNFNLELPVSFISLTGLNRGALGVLDIMSSREVACCSLSCLGLGNGGVVCHKSLENDPAYFE